MGPLLGFSAAARRAPPTAIAGAKTNQPYTQGRSALRRSESVCLWKCEIVSSSAEMAKQYSNVFCIVAEIIPLKTVLRHRHLRFEHMCLFWLKKTCLLADLNYNTHKTFHSRCFELASEMRVWAPYVYVFPWHLSRFCPLLTIGKLHVMLFPCSEGCIAESV